MGDLVDAFCPRRAGVALANSKQEQLWASIHHTAKKHSAPLTGGLWDVELHAPWKAGSVAGFGVALL
jgi:hypothetical protein